MKQLVTIKGMKCDGCAENVHKAFAALDNVQEVNVDLAKQQAIVTGNVKQNELEAALADTHYSVASVSTL